MMMRSQKALTLSVGPFYVMSTDTAIIVSTRGVRCVVSAKIVNLVDYQGYVFLCDSAEAIVHEKASLVLQGEKSAATFVARNKKH